MDSNDLTIVIVTFNSELKIADCLKSIEDNSQIEEEVRKEVIDLCSSFPIYKNLNR